MNFIVVVELKFGCVFLSWNIDVFFVCCFDGGVLVWCWIIWIGVLCVLGVRVVVVGIDSDMVVVGVGGGWNKMVWIIIVIWCVFDSIVFFFVCFCWLEGW